MHARVVASVVIDQLVDFYRLFIDVAGVNMKAPWNLIRFLPMAKRLMAAGRLPALLFAVAGKAASEGNRLGKLKDDLKLLQALCLAYWRGVYRASSGKGNQIGRGHV